MDVRVGIDFGTHQTKVCTNYTEGNQPKVFEFINFSENNEQDFFIPSQLNIYEKGALSVGHAKDGCKKSYRYFKIAAAEDEAFRGISGFKKNKDLYDTAERYDDLSPELISIIYLAHVVGFVKTTFVSQHRTEKKEVKKKSFLGRFFGGNDEETKEPESETFNFYYQIGIPTEWSAHKNRWRRRKFEQILYLVTDILEAYSYEEISQMNLGRFKAIVEDHFKLLQQKLNAQPWKALLGNHGISAFPETAAGLTYLVKTEKIGEGFYLALDIGGGSSDISFFRVNNNRTFEYLASESLLIASNNLYKSYSQNTTRIEDTEQAQDYLESQSYVTLNQDSQYRKAFNETIKKLNKRIYRIYNRRVHQKFKETLANANFNNQSCFLYGGGSLLHVPSKNTKKYLEKILLHDNGTQSLTGTRTYAKVEKVRELDLIQEVKPNGWKEYLPLLIVPLGLSFIQPEHTYDWSEEFYKSAEGYHDIRQDPGIFDLFRRRWV